MVRTSDDAMILSALCIELFLLFVCVFLLVVTGVILYLYIGYLIVGIMFFIAWMRWLFSG